MQYKCVLFEKSAIVNLISCSESLSSLNNTELPENLGDLWKYVERMITSSARPHSFKSSAIHNQRKWM